MSVRWDAVVDRARFWTEQALHAATAAHSEQDTIVQVAAEIWLYGTLATLFPDRPLKLMLPDGFSLGIVFAELVCRCGEEPLASVLRPDGRKSSHCRVFVDGLPVNDMDTPVHFGPSPALVEIILITAIEGG